MSRSESKGEQLERRGSKGENVRLGSKDRRGSKGVVGMILNPKIPIGLSGNMDVWKKGQDYADEFVLCAQENRDLDALPPDTTLALPIAKVKACADKLLGFSLPPDYVQATLDKLPMRAGATEIQFLDFMKFINQVRLKAFENDDKAGFDHDMVKEYNEIFQKYCKGNEDELRTNQMFDVWGELGVDLSTTEKQQEKIQVIKDFDADGNGLTSFGEFLQIMRKLQNDREVAQEDEDWGRLRRSKFHPTQIDQQKEVFDMLMEKDPQTSLSVPLSEAFTMTSWKNLFEAMLGRKTTADEMKTFSSVRDKITPEFQGNQFMLFPAFCELMGALQDMEFAETLKREDPMEVKGPPMSLDVQRNRVLKDFLGLTGKS